MTSDGFSLTVRGFMAGGKPDVTVFDKRAADRSDTDRQRLLRLAGEEGIRLEDPLGIAMAMAERGVRAMERSLTRLNTWEHNSGQRLQDAQSRWVQVLNEAQQSLSDRRKVALTETLVEARLALDQEAQAARLRITERFVQAVAAAAQDVATLTAQKERARSMAVALLIALAVVIGVFVSGW